MAPSGQRCWDRQAELADAFAYKQIGVSEFIISGWPELDEVDIFGRELLPLIRREETQAETDCA
jgi:hypothetical protein